MELFSKPEQQVICIQISCLVCLRSPLYKGVAEGTEGVIGELWQTSPQLCAEGRVSHLKGMNAFRKLGHMFPKEEREEGRGGEGRGGEERRLIIASIAGFFLL